MKLRILYEFRPGQDQRTRARGTAARAGPGIPEEAADALLQRGMRLDESAPGHGIGLAVVKEIAASYGGDINIAKSSLGGAKITVTIRPAKSS